MTKRTFVVTLVAGTLFGYGLAFATMTHPEVVLAFLRWQDFGLLFVLGGATGVTLVAYQFAQRVLRKPLAAPVFAQHPAPMNARTLVGAAIFGVGWGLCGVCPGPAVAGLGAGNWPVLVALLGMFAGAYAQGRWFGDPVAPPAGAPAAR
jgi:uncharacterized membrane protein YedE/YeeE